VRGLVGRLLILCGGLAAAALLIGFSADLFRFHGFDAGPMSGIAMSMSRDWISDGNAHQSADPQSGGDTADWSLILINQWNMVPADYHAELLEISGGELVDKRIYPALRQMFDAARGDGVYPVVVSGYRTAEEQQRLWEEKIAACEAGGSSRQEAMAEAAGWVAVPGTSEHQLGLAVDINADGIHWTGGDVYGWLAENAHKYGFILRYPPDKTGITGINYEPWHYRYVGVPYATEIYNQGICLEEYEA
jgi:D-alanyl-D-alanine carboxypeptidase